jgi:hypothetical protein
MKYLLGIFFICIVGCKSSNQDYVNNYSLDKEAKTTIDIFFKKVESRDYKIAIQSLLAQNEDIDMKDSTTINLMDKFEYINKMSGKYVGNQLLRKRLLNSDIGIYSYLVKYDRKFYRFIFEFYNNGNGSRIYKFKFDDTLDLEMEESLKLYTIN